MFDKFYTTKMSGNAKSLQNRFSKIRSGKSKTARLMAMVMTVMVLGAIVFANGVLASVFNVGNSVVINGKSYDIKPIHIDNERYHYTNSWYVPLRDTFEALGCTINYNVSRDKLPQVYDLQHFPQYGWRENLVVNDITSQIYGATTLFNDNMPVIEIVSSEGKALYCQIGCEFYTPFGSSPPPVIISGKTYVSIGLIDGFLTQNNGGISSVSWDEQKRDTYYSGRVTWDNNKNSLTIDENAPSEFEDYNKTLYDLNLDGRRIMQRIENEKYVFCLVENYMDTEHETCIAVEKLTGKIAVMGGVEKSFAHLIRISFESESIVLVNKIIIGENQNHTLELYQKYNLTEYPFISMAE